MSLSVPGALGLALGGDFRVAVASFDLGPFGATGVSLALRIDMLGNISNPADHCSSTIRQEMTRIWYLDRSMLSGSHGVGVQVFASGANSITVRMPRQSRM